MLNFMPVLYFLGLILLVIVLRSIRQVNQYERGVKFFFGKYYKTLEPGWRLVFPVVQTLSKIDIRTKAVDVPLQEAITKDNVSAKINAVIYYKVVDVSKALLEVENFKYAVLQLAQTTMRNVVGELELDGLLANRDAAADRIREIVESMADKWGVMVETVELKDIILPEDMQRTIAKQAEAEREKRAVIINAEGEFIASNKLAEAAKILSAAPGALHLRTLNTINDVSSDQSNTIVFALPLEILRAFEKFGEK